jgi:hypothetical protein
MVHSQKIGGDILGELISGFLEFLEGLFKERLPKNMFWIILACGIAFFLFLIGIKVAL